MLFADARFNIIGAEDVEEVRCAARIVETYNQNHNGTKNFAGDDC
jgi:hypothetical protein